MVVGAGVGALVVVGAGVRLLQQADGVRINALLMCGSRAWVTLLGSLLTSLSCVHSQKQLFMCRTTQESRLRTAHAS